MFKFEYARQILETKKLKNAELHVDIENSSDCSPEDYPRHRQNNWGLIKEDSLLKQRFVVRLGYMVLRIDKNGVSEKEVFMYVKPSPLIEDSRWSFKPRIVLDYDTYTQLKGFPSQKLWQSLKHIEVSCNTKKIDSTGSEKESIRSSFGQNEDFSIKETDKIEDHCTNLNTHFKRDIFSEHAKPSHSLEEFATRGLVKATVQSFLSNTNIGTVIKHKVNESSGKLKKHNMTSENNIKRKKSYVQEKIARFEEAAILKTTPEKLPEI